MPVWIASCRLNRSLSPSSAVPPFIFAARSVSVWPDFTRMVRPATNCAAVKPPSPIFRFSKSRLKPISSARIPAASFIVMSLGILPRLRSVCSSASCSPTPVISLWTSSFVLRLSKLKSPPSASDLMFASSRANAARISSAASSDATAVVGLKPCWSAVRARCASSLTSTAASAVCSSSACCAVLSGLASGGVPSALKPIASNFL